ncbi:MAG: hypothetical protein KKF48_02115 [Nanoarchaeota archaeon]|nr:hypothetical protein [Nanoarchaeota archaeon]MBU1027815.1 hypothetical protein [Nanoarchaeota archaeon]
MEDINNLINSLPEKDRILILKRTHESCYDENWLRRYGMKYSNPDIEKAKRIIYNQFLGSRQVN